MGSCTQSSPEKWAGDVQKLGVQERFLYLKSVITYIEEKNDKRINAINLYIN